MQSIGSPVVLKSQKELSPRMRGIFDKLRTAEAAVLGEAGRH